MRNHKVRANIGSNKHNMFTLIIVLFISALLTYGIPSLNTPNSAYFSDDYLISLLKTNIENTEHKTDKVFDYDSTIDCKRAKKSSGLICNVQYKKTTEINIGSIKLIEPIIFTMSESILFYQKNGDIWHVKRNHTE